MYNVLQDMDLSWEQRKEKERELLAKKRRRKSKAGADGDGEQKPKRRRRMQYKLIGEEWGEGAENDHDILEQGSNENEEDALIQTTPREWTLRRACYGPFPRCA